MSAGTRPGPSDVAATTADRLTYGAVHLDVVDRARSLAFWRDAVGLVELDRDDEHVSLGAGERELIVLYSGMARPAGRGHTGLYHVALHLPSAAEFARIVSRLGARHVPQAPTDHIFSVATYANDPDGLGLEFTFETPERCTGSEIRPGSVFLLDEEGRRRGPTEPLDIERWLGHLDGTPIDAPFPAGAFVGHIHLHVADLAGAFAFYRDLVGFEEHMFMTQFGMADLSAGGRFPHRLAVNDWHGRGAVPPPAGTAGLRVFELLVAPEDIEATRDRFQRAGHPSAIDGGVIETADPAGNRLRIGPRPI